MMKSGDYYKIAQIGDIIKSPQSNEGEVQVLDVRGNYIVIENLYGLKIKNTWVSQDCDIIIIKKANQTMNIQEKFVLALTPEPQKSFRKAGVTNGDDILTDDGAKIFLSWLLTKNADAFKTEVVDGLLADEEKKK